MNNLIEIQRNEITEHFVYKNLSKFIKNEKHKKILLNISNKEMEHYNIIKEITGIDVKPYQFKIFLYVSISRFMGLNFGLKLMENNKSIAKDVYASIDNPKLKKLIMSEKEHENKLISMIDDEFLKYISSIVLGLNNALIELTGALTGFTLALSNSKIVAVVGFIIGVAASLSMGGLNYLSIKNNEHNSSKHSIKSAFYTFFAYLLTVLFLITPYIFISNAYISLSIVLIMVITIIAFFNFYTSVARNLNFRKRFFEMVMLSMSVAFITYLIGYAIKKSFNINI